MFVSHDASKGGAQGVLINAVTWFKQHTNINVKVLCLQGGVLLPKFKAVADTVVLDDLLGDGEIPDAHLAKILLDLCNGKPDLIYGNTVVAGKVYNQLSKLGVPIISHIHELETSIRYYASEWIDSVIEHSVHFIACSTPVRQNLLETYNVPPEKISTVYESIFSDPAPLPKRKEKIKLRKKLGLKHDKLIVFGCGIGLPYRKGADLFIELGRILRDKGAEDFHLYWIGEFDGSITDPDHGRWAEHLERLRKDELGAYVTFLGLKDNPRAYLRLGDVFVLPSREDPFPLVALEAADCGLPVLCFAEAGGMPDFVESDAGYVVPFGDVEAMADRVLFLLQNSDVRQSLGNQARTKLISSFTVESATPHILSVCRSVAGKKPAVSIIVPNYNHARYLPQRLESIFNQTFQDFEVILLDDASSDDSRDVLERYARHADVQIVANEKNSGSPFSQWLKGIEMAKSDILWIAESDDTCDPDFLETLLPAFADPKVKLVYANSHIIDENDTIIGDYPGTEYLSSLSTTKWSRNYKTTAEQEINDGLGVKNTILNISAVLIRRFEINQEVRETLKTMRIAGDWLFIVNAIKNGRVVYDARKLNSHRRHPDSVIAQTVSDKKLRGFFGEFYVVQRYIVSQYALHNGFIQKWERYLRKQWSDFSPDQPFEKIEQFYPITEMKTLISQNVHKQNGN